MAAPVFDAVATAQDSAFSGTVTWSHTCTGTNLLLLVSVGAAYHNAPICTGVTYNGVAMTSAVTPVANANPDKQYLWYLINPATGANNVVATMSPASDSVSFISQSYTGVHQTVPLGTVTTAFHNAAGGASTIIQLGSTNWSAVGETAVLFGTHNNYDSGFLVVTPTATIANATERGRIASTNAGGLKMRILGGDTAGAATVTPQWALTNDVFWLAIGVSVKPVAGAASLTDDDAGWMPKLWQADPIVSVW